MNLLLNYRGFPVAMGRYFHDAFERLGHNVFLVGEIDPRGPEWVPWGPGYCYPKYAKRPDYIIPSGNSNINTVLSLIDFKPEVVIQAGDVTFLEGRPEVKNIIIGTDPHAVDYRPRMEHADAFFCMQDVYMAPYKNDFPNVHVEWLPYAYDPTVHQDLGLAAEYDVVFIGLQYPQRMEVLNELTSRGHKVFNQLGVIYHESNEIYNKGKIAFNWSSKMDIPARFFEGMAQKRLMVSNRLPDLHKLGFIDGVHYVGFDSKQEAIEKIEFYLGNEEQRIRIAQNGHDKVKEHTWDARAQRIIDYVNSNS